MLRNLDLQISVKIRKGENVWYSDPLSSYKDTSLYHLTKVKKEDKEKPTPESRSTETRHDALLVKLSRLSIEKIFRCSET